MIQKMDRENNVISHILDHTRGFFGCEGTAILSYAMGSKIDIGMIANILVGLMFIIMGNYMSKNRQNYTVGIRIPWTLGSEENWI